ncbi:MAG: glycosyltransferase family 4 protein [Deltaproteobacteria bacterium]
MTRVLIIETQLKQYRRQFLVDLAVALRARDIDLVVAYSEPSPAERARGDTIDLPGLGVKVPAFTLGERVVVQRAWALARDAALVIFGQANGLLLNYALLARSQLGLQRVAYWGHGYNHQADPRGYSELFKRRMLGVADWWFAYTPSVTRYLVEHGVSNSTITTVFNTIDVDELAAAIAIREPDAVRTRLGIPDRSRVGLYCGALVPAKQLGFLADAAAVIRELVPDFELVIVGAGPERAMLEAIARYRPYLHVVGPAFGADRADYFAIAEISLVPAHLGLAIVDAFAAGLPVATTTAPGHGPEIDYLSAATGVQTELDVEAYGRAVASLLTDRERLVAMRSAARASAAELSLDRMVEQFATGIVRCLEAR